MKEPKAPVSKFDIYKKAHLPDIQILQMRFCLSILFFMKHYLDTFLIHVTAIAPGPIWQETLK